MDRKFSIHLDTRHWRVPNDCLNYISQIQEFKGAWKAFGNLTPVRLTAMKRVATIESVASSNRIEGNTLTDIEVASLLDNLSVKTFRSRDEQEVAGYADVMNLIFGSWENIPVTENVIKQLHQVMLRYCDDAANHRGQYKQLENSVAALQNGKMIGVLFHTASPFETPALMQELVDWVNVGLEEKELHPLVVIAIFIVVFLAIHPFEDGNGRLSRVLTTLLLLKCGYSYVPYSSLEAVIEENKQTYYATLRLTQKTLSDETPNWEPWVHFFLKSLVQQVKRLEKKIEQEHLLKTVPEISIRILECIKQKGQVKMHELQDYTQAPRTTLRRHLDELVDRELVRQNGVRRGTFYTLK